MPPYPRARRQRAVRLAFWLSVAFLLGAATGPFWLAAAAGLGLGWKPLASAAARLWAWAALVPVALMLPVHHLENENRQRILAVLQEHPGASIQQVRRHVGVAWGTAVYHLDRLRREHLVVSHRHGNHHRYWLSNTPHARLRGGWALLAQPRARDIALAVAATPGMHQSAICEALDVRAPSASKHLGRLERQGLVAKRRVSRFAVYEPTDTLHELLRLQATVGEVHAAAPSRNGAPLASADGRDGGARRVPDQADATGSQRPGPWAAEPTNTQEQTRNGSAPPPAPVLSTRPRATHSSRPSAPTDSKVPAAEPDVDGEPRRPDHLRR